jgi:hypothetical protein
MHLTTPVPTQPSLRQRLLLLALGGILQTSGETLALGNAGTLSSSKALLIFCTCVGGVFLIWLALWPALWPTGASRLFALAQLPWLNERLRPARFFRQAIRQIMRGCLLALLLIAALWSLATNGALLIQHPLDPALYDSDAAAFVHYQAQDVLHGINPYTDTAGFWQAIAQFPATGATPLKRGQFGQQDFSPPDQTVTRLLQRDANNPAQAGPEFDPASLHSYPAGAFLLAVPFVWAGLPSTQPLYALALLLLFGLLLWWTPSGQRWLTALLLVSFSLAITLTLRSSFEVLCVLGIIAAWRLHPRHPIWAALLLGLACSVKQLAWLFVPFYLLWTAHRAGWRQAGKNAILVGGTFLLINSPFLVLSPAAWASSILLPVTEPAFPSGVGLITLAQGGLLPLWPGWVYTTLEVVSYLCLLGWYGRSLGKAHHPRQQVLPIASTALFLAPLPLLFAARSLISYSMFLPILALAALLHMQVISSHPAPALQKGAAAHE